MGNTSVCDSKENYSFMFFVYSEYSEIIQQKWENAFLEFLLINYNHYYLSERIYKQYIHRGRGKGRREIRKEGGKEGRWRGGRKEGMSK